MMDDKFTEGPWQLAWEDGKYGVIADAADGKLICIIGNPSVDGRESIRKANAILISAAPTLLAACEEVLETLTQINFFAGSSWELTEDIEMLKDAIAKARGTQ